MVLRRAQRSGTRLRGMAKSAANASVALVMMDNRRPDLASWAKQRSGHELTLAVQARLVTMLTAYLNARYACQHGYELLFYQLARPGCKHPVWVIRQLAQRAD